MGERRDAAPASPQRRRLMTALGGLGGLAALAAPRALALDAAAPPIDLCANGSIFEEPLALPGRDGFMGYLPVGDALTLRAGASAGGAFPFPLAYTVARDGRAWQNPVFLTRPGTQMRVTLDNALDEPTIVHWHGLAIDSANDGNGDRVAAPQARFDYAFDIANRAGTYWYHPHPHGLTAAQAHRGLFGVLLVDDDEDRALREALAAETGKTDLVLVLSDRRSAAPSRYAPSADDLVSGYLGDEMLVNGTRRPWLDVASRGYRLRIVNAANARTFRIAFRAADGMLLPFALLGTDGGLLAQPVACREAFVASAERIDVWLDFGARALGDSVVMESLAFDPMHGEGHGAHRAAPAAGADGGAATHADHGGAPQVPPAAEHAHHGTDAAPIGDGSRLSLLQFRVRERVVATPAPPPVLSKLAAPRVATDDAVPFRLSFAKSRWRINDQVFDMAMEPVVVQRGSVQTWLLRNYYTSMPHAMHLHGFGFRVLTREQSPDFIAALATDASGRLPTDLGVKDTVLVWPGESVRVSIDFACVFAGPQDYLFHCHNLEHEDGGMMLRVRVV
jgi:blue copper oxidase